MSTQSDQALVQAYSQVLIPQYIFTAVSCLVVYEFLITIGDEINTVWKRPITRSAVLLGSIRCCSTLEIVTWIFILAGFFLTGLFSTLRAFVVSDGSRFWSLVVLMLSMVPFAVNVARRRGGIEVWSRYGSAYRNDMRLGASIIRANNPHVVVYASRGSLVLSDTIVLVLTWIKTFGEWARARRLKVKVSLTTCLLRDGTIYFIALLAMNIAQLLAYDSSGVTPPVSTFIMTLPPLLISRFMINLRTADSEVPNHSACIAGTQQELSALQFRESPDWLGNIGETLQDGWSDESRAEGSGAAEADEAGCHETNAEA
ncbi:uncharacterized protein PHACADRAFT_201525 [Phanerochaete carnosa HHB-10118-sp]|uniref:DUF6533 domain-containing protein n=1 Tax=Phanerochaete carnosa (strain HHB-10118-sp) TaxID=650164 RepID=K5WHZ1_PHACS|nr:uncharacterized protein PHACADRAFT_201525 [Phanerochaete carnosa HHB-10118-sp]EKM49822.1 hypothetical protein PHACADRAFT_201525 [Phanerochaete carnosa HHB-10118-sp]